MEQNPPEGLSSRDRILWAAASMLGEHAGSALSVRAVAARARVSTGSLRHHFPTQRELMETVLPMLYDMVLPEDSIHESSIPPRERLIASLQRQLAPSGVDQRPRDDWRLTFERYIKDEPTEAVRAEYLAIDRELHRRVEYVLTVLENEGSLAKGDNARRARFLLTVVSGLSIAQVFPNEGRLLQNELEVLGTAVDWVFDAQP